MIPEMATDHAGEQTLLVTRPTRLIALRYWSALVLALILAAVLGLRIPSRFSPTFPNPTIVGVELSTILAGFFLFLALLAFFAAELKRKTTRYIITDNKIIREDGILNKNTQMIPDTQLERMHLHQTFGQPTLQAPVAPGGTARLVGLRPRPPLEGHHDLDPPDPPLGTVPRDPPQLVGDVIEVRPGEARGTVVPGVAVEAAEDRISDVRMLDRPAGPLEGLLVAVGDPVRLAILRLKRIGGPEDGHLAGPLADEPRSAVPHEEPVRLAVVGLHGGRDQAEERDALDHDRVQGPPLGRRPAAAPSAYKKVPSRVAKNGWNNHPTV